MNTHPLHFADRLAHLHHEQLVQSADDRRLRDSVTPDLPSSVPSPPGRRRLRFAAALGVVSAFAVGSVALATSATVGDEQPSDRLVVDRHLVAM